MIEQMLDIKHFLLSDLAQQYDMQEWYTTIIRSTDSVLNSHLQS